MFFTKKEEKSGWEINDQFLNRYERDHPVEEYRLSELYACFRQSEGRVCFWYENKFLVNLKCSETVFRTIVNEHHVFACDDYVGNVLVSNYSGLDGSVWIVQNGNVRLNEQIFDLSLITLRENNEGYFSVVHDDIEITQIEDKHLPDFKSAMLTSMQQSAAGLSGKALENHLKIQHERKLSEERQVMATRNKQVSDSGYSHIILTTETVSPFEVEERLGIITAECVYGMNIFKDVFAAISDVFGGRSNFTQNLLKSARESVLLELRKEAYERGADAVVAVDLDYSEFSGGGKSMLFIVASGTAIKIKNRSS